MTQEQKYFQELTAKWYNLVSIDHHKDRDCHFHITEKWSYGNEPMWVIEHNGYIKELPYDLAGLEFGTYEQALGAISAWLEECCDGLLMNYKKMAANPEEYDQFNVRGAKEMVDRYCTIL